MPATVPGCVHTDLLAAGKIPDPFYGSTEHDLQWIGERDWEYRCVFSLAHEAIAAEVTELISDGLDTVAVVSLNGQVVGRSENMFVRHGWSVRPQLRPGANELRILFKSATHYVRTQRTEFTPPREYCDPAGNAVRLRKEPCQFGWDWAPRLVTAGIWRDLRLESWSTNRLLHAHIAQRHGNGSAVTLVVTPEFSRRADDIEVTVVCRDQGAEVARATSKSGRITLTVAHPKLWWPSGQGEQPLYDLSVSARDSTARELGVVRQRVGLRTVVLDQHADEWGTSFQLVVNGRPIFAKGANWVPAHSFVTSLTRERYARDLRAAKDAHMNCLRVWGGGVYESESFYDLCDELGLLVWHDFMFSCALYPSDDAFLTSVRTEATDQVKRLHHRACLALWCGNNELAQLNRTFLLESEPLMRGYQTLFHELLPAVVAKHDGATAYWPSSEWRGTFESSHAHGEKSGDSHFWDVWHARHPVKDYEKWSFRFCSEFGMQSYSSAATNATFCPADDTNVFGPAMENHQKNAQGNQIILDYVSRRYRFPRDQTHLIYLSQLNQAYCIQVGVEHYRRLMPRCMGALYWQLNDCWPATSWSSIEFTGRWKALHHAARRFNAPALVSVHVPGDEITAIGNQRSSTVNEVHLFTVYDAPVKTKGLLRWALVLLDGTAVVQGEKRVALRPGESVRQKTVRLRRHLTAHGHARVYLRVGLEVDDATVSEQTVFLTPPRFMALPKAVVRTSVRMESPRQALLSFASKVFQHAVAFDLKGLAHHADDNFFDLYPGERRRIRVRFDHPVSQQQICAALSHHSLVDTYD